MNVRASEKALALWSLAFILGAAIFISGCKKNDSNPVGGSTTASLSDDDANAADAVSAALASNNGGAMDQVNDLCEIAGGVGVGGGVLGKTSGISTLSNGTYDSLTSSWTFTLVKGDSALLPLYYGYRTRNHWLQFRANGVPQKFRITKGAAADTILHQLTGGTGFFWTPRLIHHLTSIGSNWVVSGTNTDTITINGSYEWAGTDSIVIAGKRQGDRIDRALTLQFINVRGPKGTRYSHSEHTSGTIHVTYDATITTPGGATHHYSISFDIVLGGGYANFSLDGTAFKADLANGDH